MTKVSPSLNKAWAKKINAIKKPSGFTAWPIVRKLMPLVSATKNRVIPIRKAASGLAERIKMLNELLEAMFNGGSPEDQFLSKIKEAVVGVDSGHWFSGKQETDDELILEFSSTQAPDLKIIINKSDLIKYGLRDSERVA